MKPFALAAAAAAIVLVSTVAHAQTAATKWVTSWAGSSGSRSGRSKMSDESLAGISDGVGATAGDVTT